MPKANDIIGPYRLIRELGSGGFGEVWLADNPTDLLYTKVAVKLPKRESINLEEIRGEAKLWREVSGHPNIVPFIEAKIYDSQVVIVSEFAEDGSLTDWLIKHGGQAPNQQEALKMLQGILDGLEQLHSKRIVHRDLKPQNILLQDNRPRLADFGLSKALKSDYSSSSTIAGTTKYMPPEAFQGKRSFQTDIWAVGVIFQQLLVGRLPFESPDAVSLMYQILQQPPAPLPPEVPEMFRHFIGKCLEKDQSRRFKSVAEMRAVLNEEPTTLVITQKGADIHHNLNLTTDEGSFGTVKEITVYRPEAERITVQTPPQATSGMSLRIPGKGQHGINAPDGDLLVLLTVQPPLRTEPEKLHQENTDYQKFAPKTPKSQPNNSNKWWLGVGGVAVLGIIIGIVSLALINRPTGLSNSSNRTTNSTPNAANKPANTTSNTSNTIKNSIGMDFVKIPAGSFMMGSPPSEKDREDDEIQHQVTISKDFYLGKYEVTQGQWKAVMGNNPSYFKDCGGNCPVEEVSWEDVQEYIKKLNAKGEGKYRLPTEAEWEYGCRGGKEGEVFGVGDGKNLSSNEANFDGNYPYGNASKGKYLEKTVAVGSYQANGYGLYDMHGNVREWCNDWYGAYPSGSVTDPTGPGTGSNRVNRGGSWNGYGWDLRSAFRRSNSPSNRSLNLGFRLVRE